MSTPIQNVNLGRPCSATHDRLRHESYDDAQEIKQERYLADAWEEFADGELDDEIRDLVAEDTYDATEIIIHYCFKKERPTYPVLSFTDFRTRIEALVERRASQMVEEL